MRSVSLVKDQALIDAEEFPALQAQVGLLFFVNALVDQEVSLPGEGLAAIEQVNGFTPEWIFRCWTRL